MTITQAEAAELLNDFERAAARTGGVVNRDAFRTVIAFASVGDADALEALRKIYNIVVRDLLEQQQKTKGRTS